jgi:hypothetical protein
MAWRATSARPYLAAQSGRNKPSSKAPGTVRLKLKHDGLLSFVGFKINLRRYTLSAHHAQWRGGLLRHNKRWGGQWGRGMWWGCRWGCDRYLGGQWGRGKWQGGQWVCDRQLGRRWGEAGGGGAASGGAAGGERPVGL